MRRPVRQWLPSSLMALAAVFTVGIDTQQRMALDAPLDSVMPMEVAGHVASRVEISDAELAVAGITDYVARDFRTPEDIETAAGFSLYVGYYDNQTGGRTIHSPKNCLPGAGWEPLVSSIVRIPTPDGPVPANKYLLQNGTNQALVLYWYQGRGRIQASEYLVKWDLLRDAILKRRTEEALVRIVVPITSDEPAALALAQDAAADLIPRIHTALPS